MALFFGRQQHGYEQKVTGRVEQMNGAFYILLQIIQVLDVDFRLFCSITRLIYLRSYAKFKVVCLILYRLLGMYCIYMVHDAIKMNQV